MFYSIELLGKKTALGAVWCALDCLPLFNCVGEYLLKR